MIAIQNLSHNSEGRFKRDHNNYHYWRCQFRAFEEADALRTLTLDSAEPDFDATELYLNDDVMQK